MLIPGVCYGYILSPLQRLVPATGIFSLPFRDWCPTEPYLRVLAEEVVHHEPRGGVVAAVQEGWRLHWVVVVQLSCRHRHVSVPPAAYPPGPHTRGPRSRQRSLSATDPPQPPLRVLFSVIFVGFQPREVVVCRACIPLRPDGFGQVAEAARVLQVQHRGGVVAQHPREHRVAGEVVEASVRLAVQPHQVVIV
eukprot:1188175-Prorocentrum_minimum.AAC.1